MEEKAILHCDLNNFYASVECIKNPQYKGVALAVTGNPKKRTGIILAKNVIAKKAGVKTGEVIWKAKLLCPDIVCVPPDFETYAKYSKIVHNIYLKYTDLVEPFGIDECWLDVTKSQKLFGSPYEIANKIKEEVKTLTGLTISVGISFSKMFAKLGSKIADNDEIKVIDKNTYKQTVWPLPVEKLIFVGRKRLISFKKMNINTIGDLANFDEIFMQNKFGVNGKYLVDIANGREQDEVANYNNLRAIKSVGNGTTSIVDITNNEQAKQVIFYLCEMIGKRLREKNLEALCVNVSVKDNTLEHFSKSQSFCLPTNNSNELAKRALKIFNKVWDFKIQKNLIRAIRVSASSLVSSNEAFQENLFVDENIIKKSKNEDSAIDKIKNKYGTNKIKKALLLDANHINCEITDDFFEE